MPTFKAYPNNVSNSITEVDHDKGSVTFTVSKTNVMFRPGYITYRSEACIVPFMDQAPEGSTLNYIYVVEGGIVKFE